jgi:hypothetical protein
MLLGRRGRGSTQIALARFPHLIDLIPTSSVGNSPETSLGALQRSASMVEQTWTQFH